MKRTFEMIRVLAGGALAFALVMGCATTVTPRQLVEARQAYTHAAQSSGASLVPDELHKARVSLDRAEQAFSENPDAQSTIDLAYVAQRKAQLAEALGGIGLAERDKQAAIAGQLQAKDEVIAKVQGDLRSSERQKQERETALTRTREQLDAERRLGERDREALAKTTEQLDAAEAARRAAEEKADEATRELAKIAAVKEDERGKVITLSGGVLFVSGQWVLLPGASAQLDLVAKAFIDRKETIVVEGHTDSQGGDAYNLDLSQKRAMTVRDYLVSRGVSSDRVRAVGYGRVRPIADNRSAEGRAKNRRVEIVLERMHATR